MRATTASRWKERSRAAVALRPTGPVSSPTDSARTPGRLRPARDDSRPWGRGSRPSRSPGRIGDPERSARSLATMSPSSRTGGWPLSTWPESLCVRAELSWDRVALYLCPRPGPVPTRSLAGAGSYNRRRIRVESRPDRRQEPAPTIRRRIRVEQALRTELRAAAGPVRIGPARPRGPVCGRLGRRRSAPRSICGSGPGRPSGLASAWPEPLADRRRAPRWSRAGWSGRSAACRNTRRRQHRWRCRSCARIGATRERFAGSPIAENTSGSGAVSRSAAILPGCGWLERMTIGWHTRHASGTHERGSVRPPHTSPTRERGSVRRPARPIRPPPIRPTRERRSGVAHRARMRPGRTDRTDRPSLARRAGIGPARQARAIHSLSALGLGSISRLAPRACAIQPIGALDDRRWSH